MSVSKKILLPIDVAHPHPEFLPLLNELVPLKDAQVLLLYVKEELPSVEHVLRTLAHSPQELDQTVSAQAAKVLEEIKEKVEKFGATVKIEIVGGPAAMMIESVARDEGYDFTAITPGSPPSIDKYMLGRVSAKVVRHAPGAVLLLRGQLPSTIQTVVVGLDGSEHALDALRNSVSLFQLKDKGTKVILVDVVSINPIFTMISPVSYMSAIEGNLKMTGEVLLAEGEKVLSELGISNSEMKLVEGNPAEELIKVAKATQAGLIIAGSQGKGAVEHFLLGSTSTRLAAHADCPVAIFKGGNGKG